MTPILALAFALAVQEEAASQRWLEIGGDANQTEYVDIYSVRGADAKRLVWTRIDFAAAQPDGGRSARYRIEFDCAGRTYALVAFLSLDAGGGVIGRRVIDDPVREPIIPGTGSERILNIACTIVPPESIG